MRLRRFVALILFLIVVSVGAYSLFSLRNSQEKKQRDLVPIQSFGSENAAELPAENRQSADLLPASPSSITLNSNLEVPDEFRTQYERWQDGEIDLGQIETSVSEEHREELQNESFQLQPNESIQDLANASPSSSFLDIGFDSLDISQCCGEGSNVPPDPDLAVGPHHVIAVVNVAFEIYDKFGEVHIPATTFAALFSGVEGCTKTLFDPNVLYDEQTNRYILAIDGGGRYYCVAVSETDDPTGDWVRYGFEVNTDNLVFDYPQAGVGRDAIYMGGNMFIPGEKQDPFKEARVWAFDKWAMYGKQEASMRSHVVTRGPNGPEEDTPQPAHLHGFRQGTWPDSGPHYILTETNFNGATYSVFQWEDPFGADKFTFVGTFDLEEATGINIGMPVLVPQDNSFSLMTNDWRLQDAEYRNGKIWTTDTVACNRDGQILNCIRWAQIDPGTASVLQAGVNTGGGQHRFYSDIAANSCDDMSVGYTKMGDNGFPGIWVAGRTGNQPLGALHGETPLKAGELTYTAFDGPRRGSYRWGDYTGMTNDPNGRDFWYIGQYSKDTQDPTGRWGTYVGCFVASRCSPQSGAPDSQSSSSASAAVVGDFALTMPLIMNQQHYACGAVFGQ